MDMGDDSDAGDGELEDELNKLMVGGSKAVKPKKIKGELSMGRHRQLGGFVH